MGNIMVRTPIKVDLYLLKRIIKEVEGNEGFTNRSQLYVAVAERYNNMLRDIRMGATQTGKLVEDMFPDITPSIVMLRIKENGIYVKTKAGKRGRPKGVKIVRADGQKIKRTSRAEKFQNNPRIVQSLAEVRKEFKEKPHWVDKLEAGSFIYAIRLYCLGCSGGDVSESKYCAMLNCPLFCVLPRKERVE